MPMTLNEVLDAAEQLSKAELAKLKLLLIEEDQRRKSAVIHRLSLNAIL